MITGGYRSVAVEMKDHIVVIEAPQSEMTTTNEIKRTTSLLFMKRYSRPERDPIRG